MNCIIKKNEMRAIFIILGLICCGMNLSAQKKMNGIGGELSALGIKPTARLWVSKTTGFDVFGGVSAEFIDFRPNDYEAGAKFLKSFMTQRTERSYLGLMGKWKWLETGDAGTSIGLPVFGVLIGREWYVKRAYLKGFAVELGYQFGEKDYEVYHPITHVVIGAPTYKEFPLIINLRYVFYKNK